MKPVPASRLVWSLISGGRRYLALAGAVVLAATLVLAQNFAPPLSKPPKKAVLEAIDSKIEKLSNALKSLAKQKVRDPWMAEVEVYLKAARLIRQEDEFYQKEAGDWTLEALDRGLLRARQLAGGESPWVNASGHPVVRAYRSRVDGSVQPYAVTFPANYGKDRDKKWRVDVVLHGRDSSLTEVKFLHQFNGNEDAQADQDFVAIHIFGRGNNAYRWAGETDVFEAFNAFIAVERLLRRDQLLDPEKIVLRGFSMGGAGTWHLGLHHPFRWRLLGPGAGFTTTKGYVKDLGKLTAAQEACLHIYDAVDYAENAFDVPIVAYAGARDDQLKAAKNIEAQLEKLHLTKRMTLLVAPGLKHEFPAAWRARVEKEYAKVLKEDRDEYPPRVQFVTYTLRYPSCSWVEILGLERHYDRAHVRAERKDTGYIVQTANVRSLRLTLAEDTPSRVVLTVDKQTVPARVSLENITRNVYLFRRGGQWKAVRPQMLLADRARRPQKIPGLQGPIDDAFMESFLCVRGTGKRPWHAATQKYAEANLERFAREWRKYLRGELPVKDDVDVSDEDIASRHLILFGDPASNSVIADVLDELPLGWTRDKIGLGGKEYDAAEHVPVLIYPNPLNPQRYVVLNSGHTFHAADFEKTNALLYPRLGDYAVLKLRPTEKDPLRTTVAVSGLYDDYWRIGRK
jgi:dienelactone hydrolase